MVTSNDILRDLERRRERRSELEARATSIREGVVAESPTLAQVREQATGSLSDFITQSAVQGRRPDIASFISRQFDARREFDANSQARIDQFVAVNGREPTEAELVGLLTNDLSAPSVNLTGQRASLDDLRQAADVADPSLLKSAGGGLLNTLVGALSGAGSAVVGGLGGLLGQFEENQPGVGDNITQALRQFSEGASLITEGTGTSFNPLESIGRAVFGEDFEARHFGSGEFSVFELEEGEGKNTLLNGLKRLGAFTVDTALDPLTYVTFGVGPAGRTVASAASKQVAKSLSPSVAGRWGDDFLAAGVKGFGAPEFRNAAKKLLERSDGITDDVFHGLGQMSDSEVVGLLARMGKNKEAAELLTEGFSNRVAAAVRHRGSTGLRKQLLNDFGDDGDLVFEWFAQLSPELSGRVRFTVNPFARKITPLNVGPGAQMDEFLKGATVRRSGGGRLAEGTPLEFAQNAIERTRRLARDSSAGRWMYNNLMGRNGNLLWQSSKQIDDLGIDKGAGPGYGTFDVWQRIVRDSSEVMGEVNQRRVVVRGVVEQAAAGFDDPEQFDRAISVVLSARGKSGEIDERLAALGLSANDVGTAKRAGESFGKYLDFIHNQFEEIYGDEAPAFLEAYSARLLSQEEFDLRNLTPPLGTAGEGVGLESRSGVFAKYKFVPNEDGTRSIQVDEFFSTLESNELAGRHFFEEDALDVLTRYSDRATRLLQRERMFRTLEETGQWVKPRSLFEIGNLNDAEAANLLAAATGNLDALARALAETGGDGKKAAEVLRKQGVSVPEMEETLRHKARRIPNTNDYVTPDGGVVSKRGNKWVVTRLPQGVMETVLPKRTWNPIKPGHNYAKQVRKHLPKPNTKFKKVSHREFHRAVKQAAEQTAPNNPSAKVGDTLTVYEQREYRAFDTFLSEDGKVGYAVRAVAQGNKERGEIVSVFSVGEPGQGSDAILGAIHAGGTYLDAFDQDGLLPIKYGRFGFSVYKREPFDLKYGSLPDGSTPDIVYMAFDPESAHGINRARMIAAEFEDTGRIPGLDDVRPDGLHVDSPVLGTVVVRDGERWREMDVINVGRFGGITEEDADLLADGMRYNVRSAEAEAPEGHTVNVKWIEEEDPDGFLIELPEMELVNEAGKVVNRMPVNRVFRVMSEAEFQKFQKTGILEEGDWIAHIDDPFEYLPTDDSSRIVAIRMDPEDGWYRAIDESPYLAVDNQIDGNKVLYTSPRIDPAPEGFAFGPDVTPFAHGFGAPLDEPTLAAINAELRNGTGMLTDRKALDIPDIAMAQNADDLKQILVRMYGHDADLLDDLARQAAEAGSSDVELYTRLLDREFHFAVDEGRVNGQNIAYVTMDEAEQLANVPEGVKPFMTQQDYLIPSNVMSVLRGYDVRAQIGPNARNVNPNPDRFIETAQAQIMESGQIALYNGNHRTHAASLALKHNSNLTHVKRQVIIQVQGSSLPDGYVSPAVRQLQDQAANPKARAPQARQPRVPEFDTKADAEAWMDRWSQSSRTNAWISETEKLRNQQLERIVNDESAMQQLLDLRNIHRLPQDQQNQYVEDIVETLGKYLDDAPDEIRRRLQPSRKVDSEYVQFLKDNGWTRGDLADDSLRAQIQPAVAKWMQDNDIFSNAATIESMHRYFKLQGSQTEMQRLADEYYRPLLTIFKAQATIGRGTGFIARNVVGGLWNAALNRISPEEFVKGTKIILSNSRALREATKASDDLVEQVRLFSGFDPFTGAGRKEDGLLWKQFVKDFGEDAEQFYDSWQTFHKNGLSRHTVTQEILTTSVGPEGGVDVRPVGRGREATLAAAQGQSGTKVSPGRPFQKKAKGEFVDKLEALSSRGGNLFQEPVSELSKAKQVANFTVDNWYMRAMGGLTEGSETWLRLGSYLGGVSRYGTHDGGVAASLMVKASQFDYADLSEFELRVLRGGFGLPFYTWTKNNVPLQFRGLLTEPGKYTALIRANEAAKDLFEDDGQQEAVIPDWLEDRFGWVTKATVGDIPVVGRFLGEQDAPLVAFIESPATDIGRLFGPTGAPNLREFTSQLNPIGKAIAEQLTGVESFTGREFEGTGDRLTTVAEELFPFIGQVDRFVDPRKRERLGTTIGSQVAALPFATLTDRQQASAVFRARERLEEQLDEKGVGSEVRSVIRDLLEEGYSVEDVRSLLGFVFE